MRFGSTLETSVYPPWKDHYIDYRKLKKLLHEEDVSPQGRAATDGEWTEKDEEDFVHELVNVQLDKVNQFQVETYKGLQDRTSQIEEELEPVANSHNDGKETEDGKTIAEDALDKLDTISKEITQLQKYSRINFTGFLKAAKKHDRKRGLKYRVRPLLQVRLSQLPFNTEDYSPLLYRLSTMYSFARQISGDEKSRKESNLGPRPRETYTAHKFWVHTDDLLEVKTYILRRLPVLVYNPQSIKIVDSSAKDPTTTSLYFDNPRFDLYSQKVDKADEAGSLRLRWSGQLHEKPEIFLEKKVIADGSDSREIRIQIKEKNIQPFIKGEYKMEKQIKKLEDRVGPDSEAVQTLKHDVEEIQNFIQDNKLEPVLRASYTRTAFQIPGDDRIRISIDTDLALIREDDLDVSRPCRDPDEWHRTDIDGNDLEYPFSSIKKGEITRFPHALLEIKVRDSKATRNNAWLADLMSSHLVKEASHFCKFVHGVAQLFEDYVNSFPFWLSDLDVDIRQDPEAAFEAAQQKQAQQAEAEFAVGSFLTGSKMSSSPAFKARVGSPSRFLSEGKHGSQLAVPQAVGSHPQLDTTAEEHDSDEDGIQGASGEADTAEPRARGFRALLPTFSNSRYARRHRQGNAWKNAALPPGVNDPGVWIKDQGPVRVEAKVWLANQRTFVKWQHIAVLLASLSLGLYNAAGVDNNIARALALVYTAFAVFAGAWGWGVYLWRSKLITERSGKDFDNMIGPFVVSVGLAVALCLNFGFKYSAAIASRDGSASKGPVQGGLGTQNRSSWMVDL